MPLSEAVFDTLDAATHQAVSALWEEPLVSTASLVAEVVDYRQHILAVSLAQPVVNVELAEQLVGASLQLLQRHRGAEPIARRLVQVAVRYFVLEDDGDGDLTSISGLDDDRQVFNLVATALGSPDLCVERA